MSTSTRDRLVAPAQERKLPPASSLAVLVAVGVVASAAIQVALAVGAHIGLPWALRILVNAVYVGQLLYVLRRGVRGYRLFNLIVINLALGFIFLQLQPAAIFKSPAIPFGGDNSNHGIAPAYMRDYLLPRFRLFGWSPDWYAGWPIYQFYFPFPNFFIAFGSTSVFGNQLIPFGVAYKLVAVAGILLIPVSLYTFARKMRVPNPGPALVVAASLPFLFDQYHRIYGGNIVGVLVGEYSFSVSLAMGFFFLAVLADGLNTGRRRWLASILLCCTALSHVIPTLFIAAAALVLLLMHFDRQRLWYWLGAVVPGALLAAFWLIPFESTLSLTSDFGYGKVTAYRAMLLKFTATNCPTEPCGYNFLPYQVYHLKWVFGLAIIGVIWGVFRRRRMTLFFALWAALVALAFILTPQGKLWNPRIIPFWDLSLYILAAMGVFEILVTISANLDRFIAYLRQLGPANRMRAAGIAVAFGALVLLGTPLGLIAAAVVVAGAEFAARRFAAGSPTSAPQRPIRSALPLLNGGGAFIALLLVVWFIARTIPGLQEVAQKVPLLPDAKQAAWNSIPGWAKGNFMGYEGDPRDPNQVTRRQNYGTLIAKLNQMGRENGCGRVFIETGDDGLGYGGSSALWQLPYFNKSCLQSWQGMYYESSASTAYWYLAETTTAKQDSKTFYNLPYPTERNFDAGVKMMQLMGVRYLMAHSPEVIADAQRRSDVLTPVLDLNPWWQVYELAGADLVSPLTFTPARLPSEPGDKSGTLSKVLTFWQGEARSAEHWLNVATPWFVDTNRHEQVLVEDGPSDWPWAEIRIDRAQQTPVKGSGYTVTTPEQKPIDTPAKVTNIKPGRNTIEFDVDQIGKPVLVKNSYYPNWVAHGAKGPYRATPNFMVVVPTSRHVRLAFETSAPERVGWTLTLLGMALTAATAAAGVVRYRSRARGGLFDSGDRLPTTHPSNSY